MSIGKNIAQALIMGAGRLAINSASRAMTAAPAPELTDPMEGWAQGEELAQYAYDPSSVYFGKTHPDHGQSFDAALPLGDDRHMFLVAGNSAGKGTSFLIQNGIRWQGGAFFIDPKGEAAMTTAMRRGTREKAIGTGTSVRHFIGQDVAILDPFGLVKGAAKTYRTGYNPLRDIDVQKRGWSRMVRQVANMAVMKDQGDAGAHFSESISIILAGIIEKILHTYPHQKQTLVTCDEVIWQPYQETEKNEYGDDVAIDGTGLLGWMQDAPKTTANFCHKAAVAMKDIGGDEWGSFRTTMARKLSWLQDEDLREHLAQNDFSLVDVIQSGGSVYVVVDPDTMSEVREWMRVVVRLAIGAKIAQGTNQTGLQTFFMLDEFALLGHFEVIEESAGYLRGYGAKLMPIIQNIGQIKKLYTKNWETFLGNAGAIVAWGLNDLETEQYISDRLGEKWAWEETHSQSDNVGFDGGGNAGTGRARQRRPLLLRSEVHNLGAATANNKRAFVVPASGKPFMLERQEYYRQLAGQGLFDDREQVKEWERKHGTAK